MTRKMKVTITMVITGTVAHGMYTAPIPLTTIGCSVMCTPQLMYFQPGYTSAVPAIAEAAQHRECHT